MGSVPRSRLFQPMKIGQHELSSRIVMAPMTRVRADDNHVQLPFAKDYYSQRACVPGTLLITEATFISPRASGYLYIPGIWSTEQVAAWRTIAEDVHDAGGIIFLQLGALGRTANPDVKGKENTGDVVGASAVPENSDKPVPRPLSEEEIQEYINDYAIAAKNAVDGAGFDGVELHGANGYLIDQFTQSVSNVRTDRWGGSIENRSRFGLEVARAVADTVGAEKTGMRLSPWSTFQGMGMPDPKPQFSHLIKGLKKLNLAYVHLVESRVEGNTDVEGTEKNDAFIDIWSPKPVLLAGGFTLDSARDAVDKTYKERNMAIVFGRYFTSNPDLVYRMRHGLEFWKYNRATFYKAKSKEGYTDYTYSVQWQKEHSIP